MGTASFRRVVWLGIASSVLVVVGGNQTANAQESDLFSLYSMSHTCQEDPGAVGFGADPAVYDAAGCEPGTGFSYVVTDLDGTELDSCSTTGDVPGCNLAVPYGADVLVTQLADGIPAGYTPRENPITIPVPDGPVAGEAPQAHFVNLPVADGAADGGNESVTTLPGTGSGSNNEKSAESQWLLFGGATVIALVNFAVAGRKIAAHAAAQAVDVR